jgi:hypothetical protein
MWVVCSPSNPHDSCIAEHRLVWRVLKPASRVGWRQDGGRGPSRRDNAVRNLVAAGQGTAADNVASLLTDTGRSA